MQKNLRSISAATPAQSCQPHELVTDDTLRHFCRPNPARDRGEFNACDLAQLAMILPDICGELLARRAIERSTQSFPRNHAEEIEHIRKSAAAAEIQRQR